MLARVLAAQEAPEGLAVVRALESRAIDVLGVVVDALIQGGVQDAWDLAVADQGDLRVAPGGVEDQDMLLTGLGPRRIGRQFGAGEDKEEDGEGPRRGAPRPKP